MEDPVEIDEAPESSNSGNKPCNFEYVLDDQVEIEVKDGNGDRDVELETGNLEEAHDDLTTTE